MEGLQVRARRVVDGSLAGQDNALTHLGLPGDDGWITPELIEPS